ncbi:hypothetical protein PGTUg99_000277 [Puccinia graminis f. sp. tritici]|uniref:Uncharacterized protein n=1 Tax=Puccinia graminis f. sp. tritici TaxID=56615 RepID=A0A5B0NN94_PUCGR|nr:hypothetical protein PGTUg99_000277 [Puccinia graminis f. sp. tritici]
MVICLAWFGHFSGHEVVKGSNNLIQRAIQSCLNIQDECQVRGWVFRKSDGSSARERLIIWCWSVGRKLECNRVKRPSFARNRPIERSVATSLDQPSLCSARRFEALDDQF